MKRTHYKKEFAEREGLNQFNQDLENESVYDPRKHRFDDYMHPDYAGNGRHLEHSRYNTNAEYTDSGEKYDSKSKNPIKAKYGFHGYVNHPVKFLAGESGKERINIHKTRKKHHDDFWNVSRYFGGEF